MVTLNPLVAASSGHLAAHNAERAEIETTKTTVTSLSAGDGTVQANVYTASRVLALADVGKVVEVDSASASTVTIPSSTGAPLAAVITETFTGTDGTAWSSGNWRTNTNTLTTQQIVGGRGRLTTAATPFTTIKTVVSAMTAIVDVDFTVDVIMAAPTVEQYLSISWRAQTDGATSGSKPINGYRIAWNPAGGTFNINRENAGTTTTLQTVTFAQPAAGARFRVYHAGSDLRIKYWQIGDAEPTGWMATPTDAAPYLTAGVVSFIYGSGAAATARVVDLDNLTISPAGTSGGVAWPVGAVIDVGNHGAGTVTIAAASGATVFKAATLTATLAQGEERALRHRGSDEWWLT